MTTSLPMSHADIKDSLPDFVFPARGPASPSLSAPSSYSKATGRRSNAVLDMSSSRGMASGMDTRRGSTPAALPAFSFNPSASVSPESGMASPPRSPTGSLSPQPRNIPSRPNSFHKRGTSEFIGGAGVNLMSTSPTKSDTGLSPNTMGFGSQPTRRGHAHKRSAALGSVSDLSFIMKPVEQPAVRGGSAPCSPNRDDDFVSPFQFPELSAKDTSETEPESPPSKASRARVGFSDTVQFIPRPLSLVSSESSSTTLRAGGHSVSGSISSIISAPSPPAKERISTPTDARPKSAAARLDTIAPSSPTLARPVPRRHRSNPLLTDEVVPPSPSTPRSLSKKWGFFGPGDNSPSSRPTSAASSKEPPAQVTAPSSPAIIPSDIPLPSTEKTAARRPSMSRKPSKKQKKVKSWAGSILTRKARQRTQKQSRRSPTPPNPTYGLIEDDEVFEANQSEPDLSGFLSPQRPEIDTNFSSWVPRRVQPSEDDTMMSPMIDLDAALGPFNTPLGRDAEWDAVMSSAPVKKGKRMHSAALMGNFVGPGMHYHRRAASSPELEHPRFGMRHLNSSSTMADVFEEDEEDAWEDAKTSDKDFSAKTDDEEGSGIDIRVVDADDMTDAKTMDWTLDNSKRGVKRKGSGLSEGERRNLSSSMKSTKSSNSLKDEPIVEESTSAVEIFDDSYSMRPNSRAQSSDSTATPPFRARQLPKDLAPVDIQPFSLQPPYLTPTSPQSTTQSSFPSPRSPFSYDTQRISTAPSSIHDEGGFQSLLLGEPGPELRMSVDEAHDVPSLASSISTMTRDSSAFPPVLSSQFREGQRSASFSAAATRKRSSMASLSRLISSSHGEKSKLSMEIRAPSLMEGEKKEKAGKGKRISRLMQFWRPKD